MNTEQLNNLLRNPQAIRAVQSFQDNPQLGVMEMAKSIPALTNDERKAKAHALRLCRKIWNSEYRPNLNGLEITDYYMAWLAKTFYGIQ